MQFWRKAKGWMLTKMDKISTFSPLNDNSSVADYNEIILKRAEFFSKNMAFDFWILNLGAFDRCFLWENIKINVKKWNGLSMAGLKNLYFFGFFRAAFFVENQLGDALMPFQRCEPRLFFHKKNDKLYKT